MTKLLPYIDTYFRNIALDPLSVSVWIDQLKENDLIEWKKPAINLLLSSWMKCLIRSSIS